MAAVLEVRGLGKRYRIGRRASGSLREALTEAGSHLAARLRRGREPRADETELWALRDVSFSLEQGEAIGIIGRNGAGKSTLLKILSRITEPTEGKVTLRGHVASLLEVGTGFHGDLTGRENIFLNGAILGMSHPEIRRKFDEIVAFAEVDRFIDTQVKHYSTGMYMRLAFAVAAHLEPDILVVDEVLAVGDTGFQRKCLGKMKDVAGQGRTVLFVSHNMQAVRTLCRSALWLDGGKVRAHGAAEETVERYLQHTAGRAGVDALAESIRSLPAHPVFRLRDVVILQGGERMVTVGNALSVEVEIHYDVLQEADGLHLWVTLIDQDGTLLFESIHNNEEALPPPVERGSYVSVASIPADFLAPRNYEIQVGVGLRSVRLLPIPIRVTLEVHATGCVNRAYPGYVTPGRLAPRIPWSTRVVSEARVEREGKVQTVKG
jgi:lipopolysaccharide transport system ATP-binding protein